jgi:hypothetical protein
VREKDRIQYLIQQTEIFAHFLSDGKEDGSKKCAHRPPARICRTHASRLALARRRRRLSARR